MLVGGGFLLIILQAGVIMLLSMRMEYQMFHPFRQIKGKAPLKILFLGDSTAVGVGSSVPATSTAGWFAHDFPQASIENISQSGLRLAGLVEKLRLIGEQDFDLAVLQIGANDIMHLTPMAKIDRDVRTVLEFVGKRARHCVILHSGDVGAAPIFIWPFKWFFSQRSYAVRKIYLTAARDTGAIYVDLIHLNVDKFCSGNPEKYYAPDRLHLSGEGYRIWYEAIRDSMAQSGVKFP